MNNKTTVPNREPSSLELYLSEVGHIRLLTDEEERELALKAASGSKYAKDRLVEGNLRLVICVAKTYQGNGLDLSDLIQEGNLGLMKAAQKFDPAKGNKFSTYATWWIRQGITRAITDKGHAIRIPAHVDEALTKLNRVRNRLAGAEGREPTVAELAKSLSMPENRVRELLSIYPDTLSLDTPVGDDEDTLLGSFMESDARSRPDRVVVEQVMREEVRQLLDTLPEREAGILKLRYGIGETRRYTLEEVGEVYGLTRERIRQIEKSACKKVKRAASEKELLEYVG